MNVKKLKRNLRILKQSGAGLEEITFVSRRLRQILKSGDKDDNRISSGHRDNRTRKLATSRDRGQHCKVKMVA